MSLSAAVGNVGGALSTRLPSLDNVFLHCFSKVYLKTENKRFSSCGVIVATCEITNAQSAVAKPHHTF